MSEERKRWRRYGLTRAQIAECTRLRAAGDWAGACAAAGIAADIDWSAVERPDRVEEDLRHLVPDLLRWHVLRLGAHPARGFPRYTKMIHDTGGVIALTAEAGCGLYLVPFAAGQTRFALRFGPLEPQWLVFGLHGLRELWDARHTAGLLARCGGHTRLPYFAPDGTRLAGDGPEAVTERVVAGFRAGRGEQAWLEAGFEVDLDASAPGWYQALEGGDAPAATELAHTAWRAAARAGVAAAFVPAGPQHRLWFDRLDPTGRVRPRLRVLDTAWDLDEPAVELPLSELYAPEDFWDLLLGRIAPHELHPLVAAALFPARSGATGPPDMAPPAPIRVRCGAGWHQVVFRDGVLDGPHTAAELDRELALFALGGPPPTGCAGARLAWRGGLRMIPRPLRDLRAELFARAAAGEADTVAALLDAGLDPHVRDGEGRSLLHLLPGLVPDAAGLRLLDRLLAAGVDPSAATGRGLTPLRHARRVNAHPALIAALERAGG
jgi:hypothetical protein